jgi:hypothetical protein
MIAAPIVYENGMGMRLAWRSFQTVINRRRQVPEHRSRDVKPLWIVGVSF